MADPFKILATGGSSPARNAAAVVPSDGADLATVPRGLYVGTGGDLVVTLADMADGASVTFSAASGGVVHPISVKRVWSTGTTAVGIVAIW